MKNKIEELEELLKSPDTPQGRIVEIRDELFCLKQAKKRNDEDKFEKETGISVYGSDDYVSCSVGEYSFYYGYETTKCPVKSHKDEEDCYEKNCDKREWCFTAHKGDEEIVRWAESEFSHPRAMDIEKILIVGVCQFIREYFIK